MAKPGIFGKAIAGLGQGMAAAGELGYRHQIGTDLEKLKSELLAQRDKVLARYESGKTDKTIAAQKEISADDNATRLSVGLVSEAGADRRLDKQLSAKDNKPIVIPKGSVAIGTDGSVLFENTATEDKTINVPEGTVVLDVKTRKIVFSNPKPNEDAGLPKRDKDIDQRVQMYRQFVDNYMGIGFMDKLDPEQRPDFARLLTDGADKVRNGMHPEQAFRSSLKALDNLKTSAGIPGESKEQRFRRRFGY